MKFLVKRYLHNFKRSPFAYILCFLFDVTVSFAFFIGQNFFGGSGSTDLNHFFSFVPFASILFLPSIVSVASISGEDNLPFSDIETVLAKIIASLIPVLISLFLTLTVPICANTFGEVDIAQVVCGYFGILLFLISSVSFVVFLFSVFENKAVSWVLSSIVFLVLNTIHFLPVYFEIGVFSGLLKFVSFKFHFDSFAKGIISFREIFFFLLIASTCICSTFFVIQRRRENSSSELAKFKRIAYVTFALLLALNSRFNFSVDFTKSKKFSVSDYTRKLIVEIQEPMTISYYVSPRLKNYYPASQDTSEFLQLLASCSDLISFRQISPDSKDEKKLLSLGIKGFPIQTSSRNSSTIENVFSSVVVNYLGQTKAIPFVLGIKTLEYSIDSIFEQIVLEKISPVQIVVGNNLSIDDYRYAKSYLETNGFFVVQTYLPSQVSVPDDTMDKPIDRFSFDSMVDVPAVIFGSSNFTNSDCKSFEKYILNGGKVFAASQPYAIDFENEWNVLPQQESRFMRTLFTFGIYLKESLTCDKSNFPLTLSSDAGAEKINYSLWPVLQPQKFASNGMTLFWPCAFEIDQEVADMAGLKTFPILATSADSWQYKTEGSNYITNPFYAPQDFFPRDEKGPFNVAAEVFKFSSDGNSVAENPSLIFIGDQYCFMSSMINYSSTSVTDYRSLDFLVDSILRLSGKNQMLEIKNKSFDNYNLNKMEAGGLEFYECARLVLLVIMIVPAVAYSVLALISCAFKDGFLR